MAETVVKTHLDREITVESSPWDDRYLIVKDKSTAATISSSLTKGEAKTLGKALIESTGATLEELVKEEAEEKLAKRRDELARQFNSLFDYREINKATKKAIDYIIEQESSWTPTT